MRKMAPWIGILLAVVGIWKSVLRKARFVQNYRYKGWLNPKKFKKLNVYVCYFMLRKMGEMYFTYSSMYVPFKVRDSVFDEVNSHLGEKYRGDLDGFFMLLADSVPYKYTEDSPDDIGYRMVKEEYQFDTFCKRHGVKMSRLLWVMNEYRREFYRRLVNSGEMREDDLL